MPNTTDLSSAREIPVRPDYVDDPINNLLVVSNPKLASLRTLVLRYLI
jgi:hypothetical protein